MARALGIGGVFFKSRDPKALIAWYAEHLGFEPEENHDSVSFKPATMPQGSVTVWGPFKITTDYFAPSDKPYMFNFLVDDLEGALEQVKAGGAEVTGDIEEYDYGRFGWFVDPEGNKVELWTAPSG
jgi:predicted enzyme related to lactoylglutathione lyase